MARRDYLLKRAAWSLLTILFVLVLNFFLFRILPGDPTTSIAKDPRLHGRRCGPRWPSASGWTSR